ncbi:MAG TPA: hypothetical protein VHZ03_53650 [Trebonia sp.]|nr:hypothetical protein [Trebonia sp.]
MSIRPKWLGLAVPVLSVAASLAFAGPAMASGGGGGGGTVTPALKSVTLNPSTVIGGGGDTATVTFVSSPSQGAVVHLSSSNAAVAGFQENVLNGDEVVVPPGQTSATFAVVTTAVAAPTQVTITATSFGTTTATATLTVNPGTPPAPDTVHITQAQWQRGIETVQATSTNPNAILNVFSPVDGSFEFALANEGGGKFVAQRAEVNEPNFPIIVESNFGGSDTATVTISS